MEDKFASEIEKNFNISIREINLYTGPDYSYDEILHICISKIDNIRKRLIDGSIEKEEIEDLDSELSRFTDGDYNERKM